nr:hypothetical protein [Agrobacterium rosae]
MSVGVAGATITQVAHRHDVTRQQIYTWRGDSKRRGCCQRLHPVSSSTCRYSLDISLYPSLCLSLSAYADCPVEMGGSSRRLFSVNGVLPAP